MNAAPDNPAVDILKPNLSIKNFGVHVRKMVATKLASTNASMSTQAVGRRRTSQTATRKDMFDRSWVALVGDDPQVVPTAILGGASVGTTNSEAPRAGSTRNR